MIYLVNVYAFSLISLSFCVFVFSIYVSLFREDWGLEFQEVCDTSSAEETLVCQECSEDGSVIKFHVTSYLNHRNGDVEWQRSSESNQAVLHRTISMSQVGRSIVCTYLHYLSLSLSPPPLPLYCDCALDDLDAARHSPQQHVRARDPDHDLLLRADTPPCARGAGHRHGHGAAGHDVCQARSRCSSRSSSSNSSCGAV